MIGMRKQWRMGYRAGLAAMARQLPTVRRQIAHFCPGVDTCPYCAEMREAKRRDNA